MNFAKSKKRNTMVAIMLLVLFLVQEVAMLFPGGIAEAATVSDIVPTNAVFYSDDDASPTTANLYGYTQAYDNRGAGYRVLTTRKKYHDAKVYDSEGKEVGIKKIPTYCLEAAKRSPKYKSEGGTKYKLGTRKVTKKEYNVLMYGYGGPLDFTSKPFKYKDPATGKTESFPKDNNPLWPNVRYYATQLALYSVSGWTPHYDKNFQGGKGFKDISKLATRPEGATGTKFQQEQAYGMAIALVDLAEGKASPTPDLKPLNVPTKNLTAAELKAALNMKYLSKGQQKSQLDTEDLEIQFVPGENKTQVVFKNQQIKLNSKIKYTDQLTYGLDLVKGKLEGLNDDDYKISVVVNDNNKFTPNFKSKDVRIMAKNSVPVAVRKGKTKESEIREILNGHPFDIHIEINKKINKFKGDINLKSKVEMFSENVHTYAPQSGGMGTSSVSETQNMAWIGGKFQGTDALNIKFEASNQNLYLIKRDELTGKPMGGISNDHNELTSALTKPLAPMGEGDGEAVFKLKDPTGEYVEFMDPVTKKTFDTFRPNGLPYRPGHPLTGYGKNIDKVGARVKPLNFLAVNGEYTLVEIQNPAGTAKPTSYKFNMKEIIKMGADVTALEIGNRRETKDLVIEKLDAETNMPIEGVKFKIKPAPIKGNTGLKGSYNAYETKDQLEVIPGKAAKGTVVIDSIDGKSQAMVYDAKAGIPEINTKMIKKHIPATNNRPSKILSSKKADLKDMYGFDFSDYDNPKFPNGTMRDSYKDLHLLKDANDKSLYNEIELKTDAAGRIIVKDLPIGEYIVEEIEAPHPYSLNKDNFKKVKVDLRESAGGHHAVKVFNTTGEPEFVKVSQETKLPIKDSIQFNIYQIKEFAEGTKYESYLGKVKTNKDGVIPFFDVIKHPGRYVAYEKTPAHLAHPDGSKARRVLEVENVNGKLELVNPTAGDYEFFNTDKEVVTLKLFKHELKKDMNANEQMKGLEGALFQYRKEDATPVTELKIHPVEQDSGYGHQNITLTEAKNIRYVKEVQFPINYVDPLAKGGLIRRELETVASNAKDQEYLRKLDTHGVRITLKIDGKDVKTLLDLNGLSQDFANVLSKHLKSEADGTLRFPNSYRNADFKAIKVDEENNEVKLAGAKFGLYEVKTNKLIETQVSDKNGELKFENISVEHDYYLKELEAPKGYIKSDEKIMLKTDRDKDQIVLINEVDGSNKIINRKDYGDVKLELIKVDSKTKQPLEGAKFGLYNKANDKLVAEAVSNRKGLLHFPKVSLGHDYYLKEIEAPEGYEKIEGKIDLTTDLELEEIVLTNDPDRTFEIENKKIYKKVELKVIKVDGETKLHLAGAKFGLYNAETDEKVAEATSNINGEVKFNEVSVEHDYYLLELEAPEGYHKIEDKIELTTDQENGKITITNDVDESFMIINNKIYEDVDLKVIKVDGETKVPLAGAKFGLHNAKTDELVAEATSNVNGEVQFKDINLGHDYYLLELEAPEGYHKIEDKIELTTDVENGKIVLTHDVDESFMIINNKIYDDVDLKVIKVDGETKVHLAGAKFGLYNAETDELIAEAISNVNGEVQFKDINLGHDYYLLELEAPEGYHKIEDKIELTTDVEKGRIVLTHDVDESFMIINNKIYDDVDLKLIKVDEETKEPLRGAIFGLYNKADDELVAEATSNTNGEIEFKGLSLGQEYYLLEIEAPEGYELLEDKIELTTDVEKGEIVLTEDKDRTFEIGNTKVYDKVTFRAVKIDADTKIPLRGAVFGLYDKATDELIAETTSDANGEIVFEDLSLEKEYYLRELQAPDGFLLMEDNIALSTDLENKEIVMDADPNGRFEIENSREEEPEEPGEDEPEEPEEPTEDEYHEVTDYPEDEYEEYYDETGGGGGGGTTTQTAGTVNENVKTGENAKDFSLLRISLLILSAVLLAFGIKRYSDR